MNLKRSIYLAIAFVFLLTVGIVVYWQNNTASNPVNTQKPAVTQNKITVTTSFYPVFEFTKKVAGDSIDVINATPVGAEPHDFEPTPQQIIQINQSQLFVFNGAGMDVWAEQVAQNLDTGKTKTLNMSQVLDKNSLIQDSSESSGVDPHFWIDPIMAQNQVDIILNELIEIDPQNTQIYNQNANNFKNELSGLDNLYKNSLSNCTQNTVVTSHNAFNYLAKRYNFEIASVHSLSPDVEPSTQAITEIVNLVKSKNIKYVAFESLTSPKLSEVIANETGAKTIVLNPIEGLNQEDVDQKQDYISISRQNLENLKTMLECK